MDAHGRCAELQAAFPSAETDKPLVMSGPIAKNLIRPTIFRSVELIDGVSRDVRTKPKGQTDER